MSYARNNKKALSVMAASGMQKRGRRKKQGKAEKGQITKGFKNQNEDLYLIQEVTEPLEFSEEGSDIFRPVLQEDHSDN